jgi:antirestriction protein ArdC
VYFVKQLQVRDQGADDGSTTRVIPMMREYTVFNASANAITFPMNLPDAKIHPKHSWKYVSEFS